MSNPFGDDEDELIDGTSNPFLDPDTASSAATPARDTAQDTGSADDADSPSNIEENPFAAGDKDIGKETRGGAESSHGEKGGGGGFGRGDDFEDDEGCESDISGGGEEEEGGVGTPSRPASPGAHAPVEFSAALEAALAEVHPSPDPLDSPDFDPTDFINRTFPNEQSLSNVDAFVSKLGVKIRSMDEDILAAVRAQSGSGQRGREGLEHARGAIRELFERVRHIRAKAEQSEVMVQEICRDIKSLDYAKRHLTTTITALKRLHMLVTAVDQLREMTHARQYRDAANLLEATNQLFTHFDAYADDPKLRELREAVGSVRGDLRRRVFEDFARSMENPGSDPLETAPHLPDASLVVSALGVECRDELVQWFSSMQLSAYRSVFRPGAEVSQIESAERRYAWLRRQVRVIEDLFVERGVFPPGWEVPRRIARDYCNATRSDLVSMLEEAGAHTDVNTLVRCMQRTIEYEQELVKQFGDGGGDGDDGDAKGGGGGGGGGDSDTDDDDDDGDGILDGEEADSVAAIKAKYRRMFRQRRREEREREAQRAGGGSGGGDAGGPGGPGGSGSGGPGADLPPPEPVKFKGIISSCFEPYMSVYISHEDKTMGELIERLGREEQWVPEGDGSSSRGQVLGSSTDLFLYIRSSMKRCISLSRNRAFFELYQVYRKHLRSYAELLASKLPQHAQSAQQQLSLGAAASLATMSGTDWHIKLSERDEMGVCMIVSTAEYCFDTVDQLAATVRKNIAPSLLDEVDMSPEQDEFNAVLNRGVRTLVLSLETQLDPALQRMTSLKWSQWDQVGDQNEYVNAAAQVFTERVPIYARLISTPYFRFLVDKFIASFVPRFLAAIHRCKRVTDMGAQQLLIDTHALRETVLELIPRVASSAAGDEITLNEATRRFAQREFAKCETVLKVLQTPSQGLVDSYIALVPEQTQSGFQKILELKGLKKSEQQQLMDEYVRSAPEGSLSGSAGSHHDSPKGAAQGGSSGSGKAGRGSTPGRGPRAQALKKLFNLGSWTGKGSPGGSGGSGSGSAGSAGGSAGGGAGDDE